MKSIFKPLMSYKYKKIILFSLVLSSVVLFAGFFELVTSYKSELERAEALAGWYSRCLYYFFGYIFLWIVGAIYFFKFLSSLEELEEQRKVSVHNAKLRSLGEMASGIAHEINNPLTVIATKSRQLRRQIESEQYDPDDFKESLIKINQTVDRIAKIIKGLKSVSRNSEGDERVATPLSLIFENVFELCSEKFRNSRVMLKVDPIPEINIDCRESQMVQVLLNLLINAYDAVIRLDQKWIHVSFEIGVNNELSIVITDSGSGIPHNIAQNIMQPFFTTKEVGKGTGLGLSISKGIVEEHKGKLYLDTDAINTRFVVELPISAANYGVEKQIRAL